MTVTREVLDTLLTAASDFADKIDGIIDDLDAAGVDPAPKIGDRVKVIRTFSVVVRYREGHEGTVESFDNGMPYVRFDDGGRVIASQVEPVEAPAPKPTFTKGQAVRITGLSFYGADAIGKIGTVTNPVFSSFSTGGNTDLVEVRADAYTYLFAPTDIEDAPEPVSKYLDIASMYEDRRISIEPWGSSVKGAQITLKETNSGAKVFAFLKPEQMRQIIAALEANLA